MKSIKITHSTRDAFGMEIAVCLHILPTRSAWPNEGTSPYHTIPYHPLQSDPNPRGMGVEWVRVELNPSAIGNGQGKRKSAEPGDH